MARLMTKQVYSRASDVLFSVTFDTNDYNLKDWNTLHIRDSDGDNYGLFIYKNPIIISGDDVFDIKTDKNSNYVAGSSVAANEYAGYIYKLYSYPIIDSYYTNLTKAQKDEIFGTTTGNYFSWNVNYYDYPTRYNFPFTATKLNLTSGEFRYSIDKLPFTGPSDIDLGKNNTTEALFEDLPLLGRATLHGLGTTDYWALFGQTLNMGTISAANAYTSKIEISGTSILNFYAGTPLPMESSASGVNVHCCRPWDIIVDKFSFTIIGVEAKAK